MDGIIRVTPAELKSASGNLKGIGDEIKNLTSTMTQTVSSISGQVWSGEAANAYKNKFSGLQNDINKMMNMINEHVQDLNDMATQYETAENANVQASNSLHADFIS